MKYLDKKKVKDTLTISDVVEKYSAKFKVKGKAIFFLCPFHDDHNLGSCYAYLDAHSFTCSACQEKADVLKLASKFTDIPLKNMNQLLKKLVQDFELVRELYTQDSNSAINHVKKATTPTLSDEEYQLLTGIAFIRTPAETKEIAIGSSIQTVTTKYNWTYLRTLAKHDKAKYEFEVITRSRIIWRKLTELFRKVDTDTSLAAKVTDLFKRSKLSNYSDSSDDQTAIALKEGMPVSDVIRAIINDNNELLKKAISTKSYEEEITIRRHLEKTERQNESIFTE